METGKWKWFYLNVINAILVVSVSLVGIIYQQVYELKRNSIALNELLGQDIVTCIVGLIMLFSFLPPGNKNTKTRITGLGGLLYCIYIYAYFCFSLIITPFYIIYVVILGLSFYCFIFNLLEIRNANLEIKTGSVYPRKSISAMLTLTAILMIAVEIKDLITRTVLVPGEIDSYDLFYVLDLVLVFPGMIIAAVLNLRNNFWGIIFSGILLFKIITLLPGIILGDLINWFQTGTFLSPVFMVFSMVITAAAGILFIVYWKGVDEYYNL
jgi:hypothetical protein